MVTPYEVEARLRERLAGVEHVQVNDLTGTQDHYEVIVVAAAFANLGRVQQHQLVYQSLGDWMSGPIHALALQTYTPEAWSRHANGSAS
jgi:acid stress-induced BolA-like protein IbaG/YrbA